MIYRKNGFYGDNIVCDQADGRSGFRTSALIETTPWRGAGEPVHAARAELTYDDEALYVRMRSYELSPIDTRRNFGDPVCRDSCLEFFFSPVPGEKAYFNFELNPSAVMYVGFSRAGTRSDSRLLSDLDIRDNSFFSARSARTGTYWEVSYKIPYTFIRRYAPEFKTPVPGDVLRCNFYTCCDDAEQPYYTVWHYINAPGPDYHRPECFGALVFE